MEYIFLLEMSNIIAWRKIIPQTWATVEPTYLSYGKYALPISLCKSKESWEKRSKYVFQPKFIFSFGTSMVAQTVKRLPIMQETRLQSLGREDLLEKEMATHFSILEWKIPWTLEPGRLQSMGSQRIGHDWANSPSFCLIKFQQHIAELVLNIFPEV